MIDYQIAQPQPRKLRTRGAIWKSCVQAADAGNP